MRRTIVGAALATLLAAGAASAQTLHEATVDVTTSVPGPRALRLGEFTVLRLIDRSVRLQFTLASVPPAIPARPPRGQALATVLVDVSVSRH